MLHSRQAAAPRQHLSPVTPPEGAVSILLAVPCSSLACAFHLCLLVALTRPSLVLFPRALPALAHGGGFRSRVGARTTPLPFLTGAGVAGAPGSRRWRWQATVCPAEGPCPGLWEQTSLAGAVCPPTLPTRVVPSGTSPKHNLPPPPWNTPPGDPGVDAFS